MPLSFTSPCFEKVHLTGLTEYESNKREQQQIKCQNAKSWDAHLISEHGCPCLLTA